MTEYHVYAEFPACAGMIRGSGDAGHDAARVPRMRGDDPVANWPSSEPAMSSPHARG